MECFRHHPRSSAVAVNSRLKKPNPISSAKYFNQQKLCAFLDNILFFFWCCKVETLLVGLSCFSSSTCWTKSTMNQYHVTSGMSKKPIKISEDSSVKDLTDKIISVFDINKNDIQLIQVFDENWNDWLDIEVDLPPNMSKLRVVLEEKKLEDLSDKQSQSLENSFLSSDTDTLDTETLDTETLDTESELSDVPSCSKMKWPSPYRVPSLPHDVEQLLKQQDQSVLSRRNYRKIIQCLFENMVQYTLYPTAAQYTEVARALVTKFIMLKDKAGNSTGYETWRESLKNKFKHERAPLADNEDVKKRKKIFGHKKGKGKGNDEERPYKHVKRDSIKEHTSGEDQVSIQKHVADLLDLSKKRNPDKNLLDDKIQRTKEYRLKYIAENSVQDVIEKFPFLKLENQILKEVERCYGGRNIYTSLRGVLISLSEKIIQLGEKMKAASELVKKYKEEIADIMDEKEKKDLTINTCCLLLPVLFGEDADYLYCINKDPVSPTPCLIIRGEEDFEVMVDGISICKPSGLSMGIAIMFGSYYIYGIEYPKATKNTLMYIQQYIAALGRDSPTPIKVQRFINIIHTA